jgi:glycine/D-amino acid oxidase-like deaminating enzyme
MIPVRTAQVASEPLSERQLGSILPGRQGASDTRRLLTSFRIAPGNRLLMGGAWATGGLRHDALLPHLHRSGARLFGHLGPLRWAYGWSGFFPATTDHLPHLHESPDGLYCALGCNGRGIGLSTGLGQLVAERIMGRPAADLDIPVQPMRPVALHAFRRLGVAAATRMNWLRDRIDGA